MHCSTIKCMSTGLSLSTVVALTMFAGSHEEKVFLAEQRIEGNMMISFFALSKGNC